MKAIHNSIRCLSKSVLMAGMLILLLLLAGTELDAEIKALWLTAWDFNDAAKIDEAIDFALENDFTQLLVHSRYRGDALYLPNRIDDSYNNPEPVSYTFYGNEFDPLQYIIAKTKDTHLEIHAWVTVFVVTPRATERLSANHIYHRHPDWITADFFNEKMIPDSYEGAYLDPGIPEVHDYLLDVFRDIVVNYDIHGLHLDYIRYPDSQFGYAPAAMENYYNSSQQADFAKWKEEQVTRFVRRCYAEIKYLDPDIILSAAVVSSLDRALQRYSQNWTQWLAEGIIDYAYTMTYGLTDEAVGNDLNQFEEWKGRAIVGLRAWSEESRPWTASDLLSKIRLVRQHDFSGTAMFSYTGLKTLMNRGLARAFAGKKTGAVNMNNNYLFGYLKDEQGTTLPGVAVTLDNGENVLTDSNGFFYFSGLQDKQTYAIRAEHGISVFFSDTITLPSDKTVNNYRYDIPLQHLLTP